MRTCRPTGHEQTDGDSLTSCKAVVNIESGTIPHSDRFPPTELALCTKSMYIGKEAFFPADNREAAKELFARSVERIEVETHSYCNRRCDYCPNAVGDRLGENVRIPDDIWSTILANLTEIDYKERFVFTSYNEPLADRAIVQRIREVRRALPLARTMIYTNGDYLDSNYLAELADAGVHYLHISIHARPGSGYSDLAALNHIAKIVKRMGVTVRFRHWKAGEYLIAQVPHHSMDISVRAVNFLQHGTNRGGLLSGIGTPQVERTHPCHFPFAHFHIGFEGTVVPCCHIRSDLDAHRQYQYGNLREFGSIFEAFASGIATKWRRHLISLEPKADPCKTCSVGFVSLDPKVMDRVQQAWERHVLAFPKG